MSYTHPHSEMFRRSPAVAVPLWLVVSTSVLLLVGTAGPAIAEGPQIVRVEEDWVVEIGVPEPATDAPQITTVMSPGGDLSTYHGVLELNHSTLPQFARGGLQFQCWFNETPVGYQNFPRTDQLATAEETIRFTQSMRLTGTQLHFEILNGSSTTWGSFGGQGYLKYVVPSTATALTNYSPETSVRFARVGFASPRVRSFRLTEVRYYSASDLVHTDTTTRIVHQTGN